jgi:sortase A
VPSRLGAAGNALALAGALTLAVPASHVLIGAGSQASARSNEARPGRPRPAERPPVRAGDAWGRIEIPRVGLDFAVFEGDSDDTLRKGPGHVPGTASPGDGRGAGNCVIAGHRDSFFRRLAEAREGDLVRVRGPEGASSYRLESKRIVRPEDVSVLAPSAQGRLTLVTCYPFGWIGPAPYRLAWSAVPILPAPSRDASLVPPGPRIPARSASGR